MKKFGFTLAEVLITLGIIGIVAEMTIPTLMNSVKNQEEIAMLKKTYTVMQQAMDMAVSDNGPIETWGAGLGTPGGAFTQYVVPQLKIAKTCGTGVNLGCFAPSTMYTYLDNSNDSVYDANPWGDKYRLADGSAVLFTSWNQNCDSVRGTSQALSNGCGVIYVDVNGDKKPNVNGKDFFYFWITKYGIIPFGTALDSSQHVSDCPAYGATCAAWVVYKGNLDYLNCSLGADCNSKIHW